MPSPEAQAGQIPPMVGVQEDQTPLQDLALPQPLTLEGVLIRLASYTDHLKQEQADQLAVPLGEAETKYRNAEGNYFHLATEFEDLDKVIEGTAAFFTQAAPLAEQLKEAKGPYEELTEQDKALRKQASLASGLVALITGFQEEHGGIELPHVFLGAFIGVIEGMVSDRKEEMITPEVQPAGQPTAVAKTEEAPKPPAREGTFEWFMQSLPELSPAQEAMLKQLAGKTGPTRTGTIRAAIEDVRRDRKNYTNLVTDTKNALRKKLIETYKDRFRIVVVRAVRDTTYRLLDKENPPPTLEDLANETLSYLIHNPNASKAEILAILPKDYNQEALEAAFETAAETYFFKKENQRFLDDQKITSSTKPVFLNWIRAKLTQDEPAISMREIAALACKMLALPEQTGGEGFSQEDLQSLGAKLKLNLSYLSDDRKKKELRTTMMQTLRDLALLKISMKQTNLADNFSDEEKDLANKFLQYVRQNLEAINSATNAETEIIEVTTDENGNVLRTTLKRGGQTVYSSSTA